MCALSLEKIDIRLTQVSTRIPFRYGITELRNAPHAVMRVLLRDGDRVQEGLASENLPPKWFTKDPESDVESDIREMKVVIQSAADLAIGTRASSPFLLWLDIHTRQEAWGRENGIPPLLSGFGTSLVERAMLDAFCRSRRSTFGNLARDNALRIDLGAVHPELRGSEPSDFLPPASLRELSIRHTIGLGESLNKGDPTLDDGLPTNAADAVRFYGLDHLKIKTQGDSESDVRRLRDVALLSHSLRRCFSVTVDGNESFTAADPFLSWWDALKADATVAEFLDSSLVAVEQPFHRAAAFAPEIGRMFDGRTDLPPIIIDESDGEIFSVRSAMDLGYAGGTYKGCKGVIRGIMNACLVRSRNTAARPTVLTAEDLTTLPPITLLQDLAVAATLGITHIERNGHYFFGSVAQVSPGVDRVLLDAHPDLFIETPARTARLNIVHGKVQIGTVVDAPFGLEPLLDVSELTEMTVNV